MNPDRNIWAKDINLNREQETLKDMENGFQICFAKITIIPNAMTH